MKKTTSRTTKAVLASLLAVSLALPAAASAAPISTSDRAAQAVQIAAAEGKPVHFEVFKPGTTEPQPAISKHMIPQGTLIEKDGKQFAELTFIKESAPVIGALQIKQGEEFIDAEVKKNEDGTATYTFPAVPNAIGTGKIHIVVPAMSIDMWHDFDFKANTPVNDEAPAENVSVKVFKDGTAEESMMKQYMSPAAAVKKTDKGNEVTVTFPKGHYIQEFKVDGKTVAVATENKETKERTYTFTVADLTKLVNADIHVIVNEAGVNYDSNHKVQLGFNGVKPDVPAPIVNPFTDIDKDGNKDAILALYDKGIVKGAEKFNPRNQITRSQFALMVARALDLKATESAGFKDLGGITDKERLDAINALAQAGIVQKNEKFNPNGTLTRQQGALMLYRAVNHAAGKEMNIGDTSLSYYADGKTVTDPEAKKAFALLYAGNIMTGSKQADGRVLISSNDSLLRTQMAKILNGSLNYMNK